MGVLLPILIALLPLPCWTIYCIYTNYQRALRIGFPIILTPIDPFNPLWVFARPHLSPFLLCLPFGLGDFARYSYLGWDWENGPAMHARYGDAFTIVTPVENEVFVCDAKAVADILTRRKDFTKKPAVYAMFDIFGPSLTSVEGETWQRHRKITTPPFSEEMLRGGLSKGSEGNVGTTDDASLLALRVLTCAGFGMPYPFDSELKTPTAGHSMSYRDALRIVITNLPVTIIIGLAKVPSWLLPKRVAVVGEALRDLKQYLVEMVHREQVAHARGNAAGANLMSSLVHASEEAGRTEGKGVMSKGGLTDDEIYGNLLIYNIAGHETTANVLAYAVGFLACYPQWQEWLGEEIDRVLGFDTDANEADQYYKAFPQLKRCLALMYETLRLHAPLNDIPRCTGESDQPLRIDEKDYIIPQKTAVFVNNATAQCKQKYWGSDARVWRPDRWIKKDESSEAFLRPVEGSYMPWAYGPRVCPGKKFSQVEFVAVVSRLLKDHRVRPVLLNAESDNDASERIFRVIKDSNFDFAMKTKHPERLRVRWEKRRGR